MLLRQGDPLLPEAEAYAPGRIDAHQQAQAFGSGNDYLAYLPLPRGSQNSDRGVLFCNHENCYPGLQFAPQAKGYTRTQAAAERAAVGASVVELRREGERWEVVSGSSLARRITGETPMAIGGPAAGSPRLATTADPTAERILGMLGNCAGGVTPWGTVLTAEENAPDFFMGKPTGEADPAEVRSIGRLGFNYTEHAWGRFEPRFDLAREPREANRFGWIVEIDPYDPTSTPIKRTALGRFRHEGANTTVCPDGRVAVYMGDDTRGEYLYRFVTAQAWDPSDLAANRDLLDQGTLSVARFEPDGRLTWRDLVFGAGPLTPDNHFTSQADVVIEARRAADLLGATPLDRAEDVEVQPGTGRVYAALTNNSRRGQHWPTDPANPRPANAHGHVLELTPPPVGPDAAPDHTAAEFRWNVFLLAGDPRSEAHGATVHADTTRHGWFSCPDNLAFDSSGRLWIATDGNEAVNGRADGLFACDTDGEGRALTRHFLSVPVGAEACGPCFTPDGTTLFVSIQHPGARAGATYDNPSTRWPDFQADFPPRDAVIAVRRTDGEAIG